MWQMQSLNSFWSELTQTIQLSFGPLQIYHDLKSRSRSLKRLVCIMKVQNSVEVTVMQFCKYLLTVSDQKLFFFFFFFGHAGYTQAKHQSCPASTCQTQRRIPYVTTRVCQIITTTESETSKHNFHCKILALLWLWNKVKVTKKKDKHRDARLSLKDVVLTAAEKTPMRLLSWSADWSARLRTDHYIG